MASRLEAARRPPGPHPECPPPPAHQPAPRRVKVPPGAVDCHCHVIGGPPSHPYVETRSYTPQPAWPDAYVAMLDATGMTYGVLIQVSAHGSDNSLMLQAIADHPKRLKGIAVAPLGLPAREYQALKDGGVTGLRLNVMFGGGYGLEQLDQYDALCADLGWHLQFLIDTPNLVAAATRLSKLKSSFVVDHMAYVETPKGVADPAFQTLVSLVRDGGWVKVSGAYRWSEDGALPYADTIPFAQALLAAAPDRCVWGSDWPHVTHWAHMMTVADLIDLLADWAPDEALRHKVLVDNPAVLYGFPPP